MSPFLAVAAILLLQSYVCVVSKNHKKATKIAKTNPQNHNKKTCKNDNQIIVDNMIFVVAFGDYCITT
jgi:hypothetical protein